MLVFLIVFNYGIFGFDSFYGGRDHACADLFGLLLISSCIWGVRCPLGIYRQEGDLSICTEWPAWRLSESLQARTDVRQPSMDGFTGVSESPRPGHAPAYVARYAEHRKQKIQTALSWRHSRAGCAARRETSARPPGIADISGRPPSPPAGAGAPTARR